MFPDDGTERKLIRALRADWGIDRPNGGAMVLSRPIRSTPFRLPVDRPDEAD